MLELGETFYTLGSTVLGEVGAPTPYVRLLDEGGDGLLTEDGENITQDTEGE